MKVYLSTCRQAQEAKLLMKVEEKQHFIDNSNLYSVQDLIDINDGKLQAYLTAIHDQYLQHITHDCEVGAIETLCKHDG